MRKGSVFGKIFFIIILISVIENFVDIRGDFASTGFMSPFVWMFVFFAGVSLFSSLMRNIERKERPNDDEDNHQPVKEEPKVEKSEYDFDDEFAIDPKDYE